MREHAKRGLPFLLVVAVSAWIAFANPAIADHPADTGPGDYPFDAAAAVNALAHGDFPEALGERPVMGPFSLVLRAPFAAVAGPDEFSQYEWGTLPCVLAAGLLGLYLAGIARRRGATPAARLTIVALCLVNPLTFAALESGHPEEVLTAALAVGALAVASQGHSVRAALLLGLALASKQWAVIAVFPVLMALPRAHVRVALSAIAIPIALSLPGFLADPAAFLASQQNAASTHEFVGHWSVWYPFAGSVPSTGAPGNGAAVDPVTGGSAFLGRYSHALIVMTAIVAPIALALRRRRFGLSGTDAMALLAFLSLLRCVLDPVDNAYYHAPLLLALVGWDAIEARGLPVRSLVGVALAFLLWRLWLQTPVTPQAFNAAYLAVVVPAAIFIGLRLFDSGRGARIASVVVPRAPRAARAG